jgi:tetratricopeptide (TPR) repeat protein
MSLMMFRHSESPRHGGGGGDPDSEFVNVLVRRAAAHASNNEDAQALTCYGQALLLDDSRASIWFNYANVQRRVGKRNEAIESFEFAVRLDETLFAARFSLANLLFEQGRPLAAMDHYRKVIAQNPRYVPAWRNLGRVHQSLGAYEDAERCLREAIERAPHDYELLVALREVLRERESAEN